MGQHEFSVTFWIRNDANPDWKNKDSFIDFPPIDLRDKGIVIHFRKFRDILKVYVLNSDIGFRKLVADVSDHIGKDVFIAITNSETETKLYLDAELVATVKRYESKDNLEIGDFVILGVKEGDLKGLTISDPSLNVALEAEIKKINQDEAILQFKELNEITKLPLSRIIY